MLIVLPPRWPWLAVPTRKDLMLLEHVGQLECDHNLESLEDFFP